MSVAYHGEGGEPARRAPGEIVIVLPGGTLDWVAIRLDAGFFQGRARETLGGEAPPQLLQHLERFAPLDPLMLGIGSALRAEFRSNSVPSAQFLESLACVIAIHLVRGYCGAGAGCAAGIRAGVGMGLAPNRLERVRALIEQHIAEPLHIERLAAAACMSPFHFSRVFKLAAGEAPHGYLTRRRVERAKVLLVADPRLPLADVAASVGFQTQGHFTEVFRRRVGVTPRVFRLMTRGAGAMPGRFPTEVPIDDQRTVS